MCTWHVKVELKYDVSVALGVALSGDPRLRYIPGSSSVFFVIIIDAPIVHLDAMPTFTRLKRLGERTIDWSDKRDTVMRLVGTNLVIYVNKDRRWKLFVAMVPVAMTTYLVSVFGVHQHFFVLPGA